MTPSVCGFCEWDFGGAKGSLLCRHEPENGRWDGDKMVTSSPQPGIQRDLIPNSTNKWERYISFSYPQADYFGPSRLIPGCGGDHAMDS